MKRSTTPPKGEVVDDSITPEILLGVIGAETNLDSLIHIDTKVVFDVNITGPTSKNVDWFTGDLLTIRENTYVEEGVVKQSTITLDNLFNNRLIFLCNRHMSKVGGIQITELPYDVVCKVAHGLINNATKRNTNV